MQNVERDLVGLGVKLFMWGSSKPTGCVRYFCEDNSATNANAHKQPDSGCPVYTKRKEFIAEVKRVLGESK